MAHLKTIVLLALLGVALAEVPNDKIHLKLKNSLSRTNSKVNIMLKMRTSTDVVLDSIATAKFRGRSERLKALHDGLTNLAAVSQKRVLNYLTMNELKFESFWINNMILVENADWQLVERLATLYDILEIREERIIELEKPEISERIPSTNALQWGVERIGAQLVWSLPGNTDGTGVVVGGIDTGVRYTHEALRNNYRSEYGWRDPSGNTVNPVDNNGHGTHTMGSIVGADGIGVAPGAQWIACRGCATSSCSERDLTACGQFMTCPTDPQGNNPDCSKAPHLVSNSWGGGNGDTWYNAVTDAWVAAGIVPLFSQGNAGPTCGSANSPGDQPNVIGVGSTTSNTPDQLSSFSSKGPNTRGGIKPDISAPGGNVYSSYHTSDTAYQTLSGTSMACPHAAGAVALILGVAPNATISEVKSILYDNASRAVSTTGRNCGNIDESQWPNNAFGHGRIDVFRSVTSVLGKKN